MITSEEWHRPIDSHSGAAETGSVTGGAKQWRAITVVAATREPTQTLPKHFMKLVIRPVQLLTSSPCNYRNHIAESDDFFH